MVTTDKDIKKLRGQGFGQLIHINMDILLRVSTGEELKFITKIFNHQ